MFTLSLRQTTIRSSCHSAVSFARIRFGTSTMGALLALAVLSASIGTALAQTPALTVVQKIAPVAASRAACANPTASVACGDAVTATSAALSNHTGVARDGAGNLSSAEADNQRIRKGSSATAPLSFTSTAIGTTSAPQNVLLSVNTALTISSVTVATSQGGKQEFTVGTVTGCVTDGVTSNPAGSICTIPVTFQPAYPGERQMPLVVQTSAGNFQFALEGTGTGPMVAFGPGIISTVAGNGTAGYNIDNIAATGSELNSPYGAAMDGAGNLYIADQLNHRIRKVNTATGIISSVAGTGSAGYSGDNIAATSAELNYPSGVAVDGAGNLYIADSYNCRIRLVDAGSGLITTVAGTGSCGYNEDNIAATSANLNYPYGIALDTAGDYFVADTNNNRIRMVSASTGVITTVAGNGTPGYNGDSIAATSAELNTPSGVTVDSAGNLYIADTYNNRIRLVTFSTGNITTVAGTAASGYNGDNIAASTATLSLPWGVALDPAGNLYIADYHNQRVRKVTPGTGIITTIAGTGTGGYTGDSGTATSAALNYPSDVVLDSIGNLYIVDNANSGIRKVDVSDSPSLYFGYSAPNSTSAAQDVTVLNLGNTNLSVSSISTPSAFSLGGADTSCNISGQILDAAASCVLGIEFAPTTTSLINGKVVLTDNTLNTSSASQTISVQGDGSASPATITSPANGSTLTAVSTTFTWSPNGSSAPVYLHVGTTAGGVDLVNIGPLLGTSKTISLPVTGATIYVTLESEVNGQAVDVTNTYTEATLAPATIISPANYTAVSGPTATFTWAMNGSTAPVYLHVSATYGGLDLVNIGPLTGTSATVTVPTTGTILYATLESQLYGTVDITNTYNYSPIPAQITSPAPGSTLTGATTTFTWSMNSSVAPVYLHVGTTVGGTDLVNIGPLSGTSTTVTLPTLGATIYVTLESQFNGKTVDIPYTYTEASQAAASITSPANGSTLTGATTTFLWTMNGSTAPVYLHVGTTVGGVDLVNIGPITGGSTTVTLPTLGATIYVTLESQVNGKTVDVPYTYTEASQAAASITSPANGSQLGSTQTFTWVYNGSTDPVYLHIGSTPGGIDIVNIGPITGGSTTVNLPTDGATVYVTLESQVNGQTVDVPYTYTDPTSASPSNNSRNPNATRKK